MSDAFISSLVAMFPDVPCQKVLGIEIVEVGQDYAKVLLPFKPEAAGGASALHGGAIASLLDLTGALAAWSGHDVSKGMKAATVTVTTNYLAAAHGSSVVAHGRAVKRGKELIFCEVTICEADSEKTIANGTMIY